MPYKVFRTKEKKPYCVFTVNEDMQPVGSSHGCHATPEEARKQQQALYANTDEKALHSEDEITDYPEKMVHTHANMTRGEGEEEEKAVMKKEGEHSYPASAYLVVEDSKKPSTWHMRVYDENGNLDHRMMGAAHAALVGGPGGHRGNPYAGPNKQEAIRKLKGLYKKERMEWEKKEGKAMSLDQIREEITLAFYAEVREDKPTPTEAYDCWVREVYLDHLIVDENREQYRVNFSTNPEGDFEFAPRETWTPVREQRQWIELPPEQKAYYLTHGNTLKAVEVTPDTIRVGNYLILFDGRDLEGLKYPYLTPLATNPDGTHGEYFAKNVDIESDYTKSGVLHVDFEHGRDPDKIGNNEDNVLGYVDMKTVHRDENGIYAERVLNRHHQYMKWLDTLIEAGVVGSSTKPVQKLVQKATDGKITRWGLMRDTLTVTPMDHRMVSENVVEALKALDLYDTAPPQGNSEESAREVVDKPSKATTVTKTTKENAMTKLLEVILASDLPADEKAALIQQIQKPAEEQPAEDVGAAIEKALNARGFGKREGDPEPKKRPDYEMGDAKLKTEPDPEAEFAKSVHIAQYGDEDAAKAAIFTDVVGSNYQQRLFNQDVAFARYLRLGKEKLSLEQQKALEQQIYPLDEIMRFVYEKGMSVEELKATQVEAQGSLGGFAVPPARQSEWIKRVRGLTAVRQGGAMVVVLANSNAAEFIEYTGGDTRYVGNLRGVWGGEAATPTDKNMTLGTITVPAHVYTYRVKFSQSLVEDSANLVTVLGNDIVDTLAIDEDEAFLIGDGNKKPRGILPAGANAFNLTEVISGAASTLEAPGVKLLKRGVASQYRQGAVWIANSDTWGAVEVLEDGQGMWVFPDLSDSDQLLNRSVYESEAMPDVAAGTYPIIFGNMRGYGIVERLGLTVERFHDALTGANQTWFDVRRRIGGRILYPWMFAVQKVSAT